MSSLEPTMTDLDQGAQRLASTIMLQGGAATLAGIPRGGVSAALLVANHMNPHPQVITTLEYFQLGANRSGLIWLVDDIVATGAAINGAREQGAFRGAAVLYGRPDIDNDDGFIEVDTKHVGWVVFPWEAHEPTGPEEAVARLIEFAGDDPNRKGLEDTPKRVLKYLREMAEGEGEWTPTSFATNHDDLVMVDGIPFASLCEHHMLPYSGTAAVGYVPDGKLLGLSKLARFVEEASRGLTMQEHVTRAAAQGIAKAITNSGGPDHETTEPSVAVFTRASHTCMTHRGIKAHGTTAALSVTLGRFRTDQALRAEFFATIRT